MCSRVAPFYFALTLLQFFKGAQFDVIIEGTVKPDSGSAVIDRLSLQAATEFYITPTAGNAPVGGDVTFSCLYSLPDGVRVLEHTIWRKDKDVRLDVFWLKPAGNDRSGLTFGLRGVQEGDAGRYGCNLRTNVGDFQVETRLEIGDQPARDYTVSLRISSGNYAKRFNLQWRALTADGKYDAWTPIVINKKSSPSNLYSISLPAYGWFQVYRLLIGFSGRRDRRYLRVRRGPRPVRPPAPPAVGTPTLPPRTYVAGVHPAELVVRPPASTSFLCLNDAPDNTASITWSHADGSQLAGDRFEQIKGGELYIADVRPEDAGVYLCTVQYSDGVLTATGRLVVETPTLPPSSPSVAPLFDVAVTLTPSNARRMVNGFVNFTCEFPVSEYPFANVVWKREDGWELPASRLRLSGSGRMLHLHSLKEADTGRYTCYVDAIVAAGTASGTLTVVQPDSVTILPVDTSHSECNIPLQTGNGKLLSGSMQRYFQSLLEFPTQMTVDVVLVVEESPVSMAAEHGWLVEMVNVFEAFLGRALNQQAMADVRFSLVGFGRAPHEKGRVIKVGGNSFYPASEVAAALTAIRREGHIEDGYCAIRSALDALRDLRRDRAALEVLLLTDESRDILCQDVTYEEIHKRLKDEGANLHTIVKQSYKITLSPQTVFGMDFMKNGYQLNLSAPLGFSVVRGASPVPDSDHSSTHEDYTSLALALSGSTWSVDALRSLRQAATVSNTALQRRLQNLPSVGNKLTTTVGINTAPVMLALTSVMADSIRKHLLMCAECSCEARVRRCAYLPKRTTRDLCLNGEKPSVRAIEQSVSSTLNSLAVLACSVTAHPDVQLQWHRADGGAVDSRWITADRRLVLPSVTSAESGRYICSARNVLGVSSDSVTIDVSFPTSCRYRGVDMDINTSGEFRGFSSEAGLAADFIWLVDQSRSMEGEHKWLPLVNTYFNVMLANASAQQGSSPFAANLFGLVGFGEGDAKKSKGVAIRMPNGRLLGMRQQFEEAMRQLKLNGQFKDGFHAIRVALTKYKLRQQAACHILLLTDSRRTVIMPALSSTVIAQALNSSGCSLHVIVQKLFDNGDETALGFTSTNDFYLQLPNGGFKHEKRTGSSPLSTGGASSNDAYVQLAMATGGSAWDVNKLRGDAFGRASFSRALASFMTDKTIDKLCQRCTCMRNGQISCQPCTGQ